MSLHSGWLSLGAIAAFCCALCAGSLVEGYFRHMPTGDQAGVALGLMFFLEWLLPAATIPMVVGARVHRRANAVTPESARVPKWISVLLIVSGCVLAVLGALYVALQAPSFRSGARPSANDVLHVAGYAASLAGFAGIWIAMGLVGLRTVASVAPRALPAFFLFTAFAAVTVNAALLLEGFHGAYPGEDRWALLVRNLLYFSTPSLVLTLLLLWGAWNLTRRRNAELV